MTRRQQKHDMLINFYANAKAVKKSKKTSAPFYLIAIRTKLIAAGSRLMERIKERVSQTRFLNSIIEWHLED